MFLSSSPRPSLSPSLPIPILFKGHHFQSTSRRAFMYLVAPDVSPGPLSFSPHLITPTHGRRPPPLPNPTPLDSLHPSQAIEATNAANLAQLLLCSHITSWSLPEPCVNLYPSRCRLGLSAIANPPSTDPDILPGSRYFRFTDHPRSIEILSEQVPGLAQKRSHHGGKHAVVPTTPLYKTWRQQNTLPCRKGEQPGSR